MMNPADETYASVARQLRSLQTQVRGLPSAKNVTHHTRAQRNALADMQDALADAAKLAHDITKTDDPVVRRESRRRCIEHLEAFREALLAASSLDLVDSVDVAHLGALGDMVSEHVHAAATE